MKRIHLDPAQRARTPMADFTKATPLLGKPVNHASNSEKLLIDRRLCFVLYGEKGWSASSTNLP
jgi:hypothetical protein